MSERDVATLNEDDRDRLLENGGTGVLAFSTPESESPRTIPVSYGYDASQEAFYFRLSTHARQSEEPYHGQHVTFVTYGEDEDGWWSILAKGTLADIERDDIATESLDGLDHAHIPLVDIFGEPPKEVTFEFLRLAPETFTGRRESSTTE